MDRRIELHETFCEVLGSRNAYFQPPENLQMEYPAIVYSLEQINRRNANNTSYMTSPGFSITLIDEDPDSIYIDKLMKLPYCRFNRHYKADDLNHWNFTIY